jgi:hypothetical protein
MVNKAPVQALADLIQPQKIIVHFIASGNLEAPSNSFLKKKMTPWHIHRLAVDISRHKAYQSQCDVIQQRGIELIEVRTNAPAVDPNSLENGISAYYTAREIGIQILASKGF